MGSAWVGRGWGGSVGVRVFWWVGVGDWCIGGCGVGVSGWGGE